MKGTLRSSKAPWVLFGFVYWEGLDLLAMTFQCRGREESDCPALRTGWEVRNWRQLDPPGLEEGKDSTRVIVTLLLFYDFLLKSPAWSPTRALNS